MKKLYISGPMSGYPDFNRQAFYNAEDTLQAIGYTTLSPARIRIDGINGEPTWEDWMRPALKMLLDADAICLLPGWHQSRGVQVETNLANTLGIEIYPIDHWLNTPPEPVMTRHYEPRILTTHP